MINFVYQLAAMQLCVRDVCHNIMYTVCIRIVYMYTYACKYKNFRIYSACTYLKIHIILCHCAYTLRMRW